MNDDIDADAGVCARLGDDNTAAIIAPPTTPGRSDTPDRSYRPGLAAIVDQYASLPSDEGKAYIEKAIASIPERRVRRSRFNGAIRYAGEKMAFVTEGESHTGEQPLIEECEWQPTITAYFTQPPSLDLDYNNKDGRRIRTRVTPDCLVQFDDGRAAFVEMVRVEEARAESEKGNPRFSWDVSSGRYIDRPMSERCSSLGIASVLLTTDDVNNTLVENYRFLGKGTRSKWSPTERTSAFIKFVRNSLVTTYQEATQNKADWDADDVIGAIAHRLVYVNLHAERLQGYVTANIYPSKEHHTAQASSPKSFPALPDPAATTEKFKPFDLSCVSDSAITEAFRRFATIKACLNGEARRSTLNRLERRYLKSYQLAAAEYGAGFVGLIPDYGSRGFSGPHLDETVENLLCAIVKVRASDPNVSPDICSYGALRNQCKALSVQPPSKQTYHVRLREARATIESKRNQYGDSAAYQAAPAGPLTPSAISRAAARVWQLGLMDHTPLPIRLIESIFGTPIPGVSPWLTHMRDSATTKAIGMYLSWGHPSEVSIMGALWDCFKRYGRLPEGLLLDGEKAHDSVIVEKLLATMEVDKICRRYLCPRDGSGVERDFKLIEHALLCYLQGNYVLRQNPDQWPRGWNPANFADRTLGSLWLACRKFLFGYCNGDLGRASLGGLTPDQTMEASLRIHGNRGFRIHPDPAQARHILLPRHSRGTLQLTRSNGVRPFGQPYLPTTLIDPVFYDTDVPVRFDPVDPTYVIARLGNQWTPLRHRHYLRFEGLSEDLLAAIAVELRETYRRHEKDSPERAERHAEAIESVLRLPHDPLGDWLKGFESGPSPATEVDNSIWSRVTKNDFAPAQSFPEIIV